MYYIKPIMSQDPYDCGLCSIKMLLAFYGKEYMPFCGLERDPEGTTAKAIMSCGEKHGLDMRAYRASAEDVILQDRPAIILWDYIHWCVYCGKGRGKRVYICDSLIGRYVITESAFTEHFSGIEITNGEPHDIMTVHKCTFRA